VSPDRSNVVLVGNSDDGLITNGFEIKHKTTGDSATLCCATLVEKNAWVKDIRAHIKEYQKQENARRKIRLVMTSPSPGPSASPTLEKSTGASTPTSASTGSPAAIRRTNSVSAGTRPGLDQAESDIPPPPSEDGAVDWKEKQDNESTDPPGFVRPPRKGDWLQYHHEEHGIPYYYNMRSKETTWFAPPDWNSS